MRNFLSWIGLILSLSVNGQILHSVSMYGDKIEICFNEADYETIDFLGVSKGIRIENGHKQGQCLVFEKSTFPFSKRLTATLVGQYGATTYTFAVPVTEIKADHTEICGVAEINLQAVGEYTDSVQFLLPENWVLVEKNGKEATVKTDGNWGVIEAIDGDISTLLTINESSKLNINLPTAYTVEDNFGEAFEPLINLPEGNYLIEIRKEKQNGFVVDRKVHTKNNWGMSLWDSGRSDIRITNEGCVDTVYHTFNVTNTIENLKE